jgi:hypothetical protein
MCSHLGQTSQATLIEINFNHPIGLGFFKEKSWHHTKVSITQNKSPIFRPHMSIRLVINKIINKESNNRPQKKRKSY